MPPLTTFNRVRDFFEQEQINKRKISAKKLDEQFQDIIDYLNNTLINYLNNFVKENIESKIASQNPDHRQKNLMEPSIEAEDQNLYWSSIINEKFENKSIDCLKNFLLPERPSIIVTDDDKNLKYLTFQENDVLCMEKIGDKLVPAARKLKNIMVRDFSISNAKIANNSLNVENFAERTFSIVPKNDSLGVKKFKTKSLKNVNLSDGALSLGEIFTGEGWQFNYWTNLLQDKIIDKQMYYCVSNVGPRYFNYHTLDQDIAEKIPITRDSLASDFMLEARHFSYVPPPAPLPAEPESLRYCFRLGNLIHRTVTGNKVANGAFTHDVFYMCRWENIYPNMNMWKPYLQKPIGELIADGSIDFVHLSPVFQLVLWNRGVRW